MKYFNWRNIAISLAMTAALSVTAFASSTNTDADICTDEPALVADASDIYDEEETVDIDITAEDFETVKAMADKGDVEAMSIIGVLYYSGEGVKQDYGKALHNLNKAANAGNTDAMVVLADMYANGKGVDADMEKAIKYFSKAAENGNEAAQQAIKMLQEMEKEHEAEEQGE